MAETYIKMKKLNTAYRARILLMLAALLLLGTVCCPAFAKHASKEGKVPGWYKTTTALHIRTSDNARAKTIATVPKGKELKVNAFTQKKWAKLDFKGRTAYCSGRYIVFARPVTDEDFGQDDDSFPCWYKTTTELRIRTSDNTRAKIITSVPKGTELKVNAFTEKGWAELDYNGRTAYCSGQYIVFSRPVIEKKVRQSEGFLQDALYYLLKILQKIWSVLKYVLIAIGALLIIAFKDQIIEALIFIFAFTCIGALITYFAFENSSIGAAIGFIIAILTGIRIIADNYGDAFPTILGIAYYLISFPFYTLNRLQYFLSEPWRCFFRRDWAGERYKPFLRVFLEIMKILLYIAITPLRVINAILYNLIIHVVTELYDLIYEVLQPCDDSEGASELSLWLFMFPWRIIKYPLFHGALTIIESIIWTVVDVFIPAVTLYHGTDLTAGDAILCSPNRNGHLKRRSSWSSGNFMASCWGWGGAGVYFAARRKVAQSYALDEYRLGDDNPIMIVCRVSLGRIINYSLAPYNVYSQAGEYGNHHVLNDYGDSHGYTTGEWWNRRHHYWEYCLFDNTKLYDYPWRIRPLYAYNFRTNRAQHISGGMQHWLFYSKVLESILFPKKRKPKK